MLKRNLFFVNKKEKSAYPWLLPGHPDGLWAGVKIQIV
jgi:hypothetical protein